MEVKAELIVITSDGKVYTFDPWTSSRAERESHGPIEREALVIYSPSPVVIRTFTRDGKDVFFRTVEQKLLPDGRMISRTWLCLGSAKITLQEDSAPLIDVS